MPVTGLERRDSLWQGRAAPPDLPRLIEEPAEPRPQKRQGPPEGRAMSSGTCTAGAARGRAGKAFEELLQHPRHMLVCI